MKKIFCVCLCVAALLACCGCGNDKEVNKDALAPFVGEWDCQESTLEERGDEGYLYVGYFTLRVEEDGSFSMYDGEAGNPGLAGTIYPEENGTAVLDCGEEFEPPVSWSGMEKEQKVYWGFFEEDGLEQLHLTWYNDSEEPSTLVFDRWK